MSDGTGSFRLDIPSIPATHTPVGYVAYVKALDEHPAGRG